MLDSGDDTALCIYRSFYVHSPTTESAEFSVQCPMESPLVSSECREWYVDVDHWAEVLPKTSSLFRSYPKGGCLQLT